MKEEKINPKNIERNIKPLKIPGEKETLLVKIKRIMH